MPLKFYSNPFSAIPSQFCEVSVADRWAPLLTSPLSPIQAYARAARRASPPAARPRSTSPPPGAQRHGRARSAFLLTPAAWPLLLLPNSASARSAPPRHGPSSSSLPPSPRRAAPLRHGRAPEEEGNTPRVVWPPPAAAAPPPAAELAQARPHARAPSSGHRRREQRGGAAPRKEARRGEVSRPWRPEASRWAEVEAGRARAPPSSREGVVCAAAVEATPNRPGRRAMALLAGGGRGRVPPPQRASTVARPRPGGSGSRPLRARRTLLRSGSGRLPWKERRRGRPRATPDPAPARVGGEGGRGQRADGAPIQSPAREGEDRPRRWVRERRRGRGRSAGGRPASCLRAEREQGGRR